MSFHLYDINELYSNADGSIQFIELKVGSSNSENFWQGHTISVTQGATTHSYTFPSNLPNNTANTSVLIATQGFADLGIVVPNYVVPSGFLFTGGGSVNFADVDSVVYAALPTRGTLSVNRSGATGTNSPTNFAGATGTVPAPAPVNQPPTVVNALADQTATEDSAFSFSVPANAFADADAGDTLSYAATKADGTALPVWLTFTVATRTFGGTPANGDVGSLDIQVSATDSANASVSDSFAIAVANSNDAPALANDLADRTAIKDSAFSINFAANAFADVDAGDTLSYSATLDGGAALPSWLSFNAGTRTFSGTPGASDIGTIDIKVTATDSGNASATDVFVLAVSDTSAGKAVDLVAYNWKAHILLDGVSITAGATAAQSTGPDGSASFTGIADTSLALSASRAIPSAETTLTDQAVNLQDAISILKMIVGLEVNGAGRVLSPYQALAADYDGNGQVQLTDAIGVLKHVVGLEAPAPAWHFASETDTAIPQLAPLSPGAAPAISVDLSLAASPVHVGLVAYLSGDVDGSFAGATNSQDLDEAQPGYFTALTQIHALDPAQFGVYS